MPRFKPPRKAKEAKKADQSKQLLDNLQAIKKKLKEYEGKPLPTIQMLTPEKDSVQQTQVTQLELTEVEQEIDKLIKNAAKALAIPLPRQLEAMAETMAIEDHSMLAFRANEFKKILQTYHHQVDDYYLNNKVWQTSDAAYQNLLNHPQKYSSKVGGAKNTGKRTGVYAFKDETQAETMLIKQGADVGETVAEYIGANLYGLTISEHSARCIMVSDNSNPPPSINEVYVASIYQKADKIQDAYAAAGYGNRGLFAGAKARLKDLFNMDESLVRKILDLNDESGHTLERSAANVLWHGDHDFHSGNVVFTEEEGEKKFIKIDDGFSFFNFNEKVVDIFNPIAGKILSFSPKKFAKGGKLVEFYPTNHFWDYAIENKRFYYNAHFVKACEEIANCKPEDIRSNIEQSLNNIQTIYGQNANDALKQFALRIGMKANQIEPLAKGNPDLLRYKIEDHMVYQLLQRQASMSKLAEHCKKHTAMLDKKRNLFSKKLNKMIIKGFEKVRKLEEKPNKPDEGNFENISHQKMLLKEIDLLKLVQQANDLGILEISNNGEFTINDAFYFNNSGQRELVTPNAFKEEMSKIVSNTQPFNVNEKYPLSEKSLTILREIRLNANNKEPSPSRNSRN